MHHHLESPQTTATALLLVCLLCAASPSGAAHANRTEKYRHHGDAPPTMMEPCPADSIREGDTCKCAPGLCHQPPCPPPLRLEIVRNATDTPGNCCPLYACEGCTEEERAEAGGDRCPCVPGAAIGPSGLCECLDPHRRIVDGECRCDPDMCPLPQLCEEHSVAVFERRKGGCCDTVECKTCPDDSFPTKYDADQEIENKCVCLECPKVRCPSHQSPVIKKRGRNEPGRCCDIYECVSVSGAGKKGCDALGPSAFDDDGGSCECKNGIRICKKPGREETAASSSSRKTCFEGGDAHYKHGESWMRDTCTNCTCLHGEAKCIAHMCDVASEFKISAESGGCPSMDGCMKECEHGYRVNRLGCELCKCKVGSDKSGVAAEKDAHKSRLDALLKEYNLTEEEVVGLVKQLAREGGGDAARAESATANHGGTNKGPNSTTKSPPVQPTSICMPAGHTAYASCTYSCILEYSMPGFVVGAIFAGLLFFSLLKFAERNRQKYEMAAYTYRPVGKEAVANGGGGGAVIPRQASFPTSIIKKAKTYELQNYSEKKAAAAI